MSVRNFYGFYLERLVKLKLSKNKLYYSKMIMYEVVCNFSSIAYYLILHKITETLSM